jgi:hypothetical protein
LTRKIMMMFVAVTVCLLLAFVGTALLPREAQAQNVAGDFRTRMVGLWERQSANSSFVVHFQFHTALIVGESTWSIGDPADTSRRVISEIGTDYVCFTENYSPSTYTRCTPFTNIASVSYTQ